jgi:hypothetical protein
MSLYKLLFTKLQFVKNLTVSNIILKKGVQLAFVPARPKTAAAPLRFSVRAFCTPIG